MTYVWTVLGTTAAFILAEIVGNYGLGDLVKDLVLRLFGKAESLTEAKVRRLKSQLSKILLLLVAICIASVAHASPATLTVTVQGTSHTVTATWTASPDATASPTITYNVYRATGSCTATTFTNIGSVAAGVLTFTDTNVSTGETLSYEITAVLNGIESAPSPCAQVTLPPSSPGKPTLTHN